MKNTCLTCEKTLVGRSDKQFCGVACKNTHHTQKRKNELDLVKSTDALLHRNRQILAVLMGDRKKEIFDREILEKTGFHFEHMTGVWTNQRQQLFQIIYDYAWTFHSEQQVMIIRKTMTYALSSNSQL